MKKLLKLQLKKKKTIITTNLIGLDKYIFLVQEARN